jgi:hypothetical protein
MDVPTLKPSPEAILQRIDAIIYELAELRKQVVQSQAGLASDDLAQQLYGALGQGSWSEYDPLISRDRI